MCLERSGGRSTGVGHQHVHVPVSVVGSRHHRVDIRGAAHVSRHRHYLGPDGGQRRTRLLEGLLTTRADDQLAAFGGELLGDGAP